MNYSILYFIDGLNMGGAELITALMLKHLDTQRFTPRICVFREPDNNSITQDIQNLNIPIDLIPIKRLSDFSAIPRINRYLTQQRPDIVHTQLEASDILASFAAHKLGIPSVSTIHTMPPKAKKIKAKIRQKLAYTARKYCSNKVICVSEESRQYYLRMSG